MRVAVDTNIAVDLLRGRTEVSALFAGVTSLVVPLPVAGELYAGIEMSSHVRENRDAIEKLLAACEIVTPHVATAQIYGRIRLLYRRSRDS